MSDSSIAPFAEPHWHHTIPPPYYKSSHLKLQAETRKYVDEFIAPFAAEWEKNGAVPAEVRTTNYDAEEKHPEQ